MKNARISLLLLVVITMLLCSVSAWAKGAANVRNTIHNMSTTAPIDPVAMEAMYGSDESEVCIFCHTPHGGVLNGPLWNRSLATGPWTHYNSASLSTYLKGLDVARPISDESLLCMSCHDGSISVMHLLNPSNSNGQPISTYTSNDNVKIIGLFDGNPGAKIGGRQGNTGAFGDLSDDHPISFSYESVLASGEYGAGGVKENQLRTRAQAETWLGEGVRFFGPTYRVECSSCHDPHVDYVSNAAYTPFLIRPNAGSNLCLACHNK